MKPSLEISHHHLNAAPGYGHEEHHAQVRTLKDLLFRCIAALDVSHPEMAQEIREVFDEA